MTDLMSKIISLCKRRGFIFQSSEIYGGFGSCYDFGPLGVEMKNNIKKAWWDEMTKNQNPPAGGIVGLDAAILMSPKVWEASGHLTAGFADELVECKECHKRFRLDELKMKKCPECGGQLTEPRKFNLMMKTHIGPVEDDAAFTYLRAETCQGIYVNFENILNTMRLKIPFGVAQIGKAFRNEITPGDFIYRTREFEQMEMQWFCHPKDAEKYFDYWQKERLNWYINLGIKKENLRIKEVPVKERPHYAKQALDLEYKFPFGWKEIEGIHNRGDWDLSNHSKYSGKDLKYEGYYPYIIETSGGADRSFLAFLCDAYQEILGGRTKTTKAVKEIEILLKLDKKIAPIKIAILPLVRNKPELVKKAKEVYQLLKPHFTCQYDELGSIGRRYRRVDEIGCPWAITIDFETLKDDTVTLRYRDTMKQERVKIKELIKIIKEKLNTQ
ncbi:MAG: glycine--tRNA ligase [Candidatus Nealsonbacteria bacterium CG_4_8_14_3_um_filter_37_36]|uniref:glycine--tRNA ligase n=3 Tax=Candidatus Nealsoniibacteriota TaxID=1817911 RepID=A0A2M7EBP4_9BACT|nr:MAG: glycine--tRNA ligase [Candidatus Nealsonbacteria bacterium CG01_land_8_20_14_3_00_12]PIW91550.1 MAG: glycine--tRNA ligase [Candidatus Nealsonbacteria bacterium CG_4_8_14_3_um_filter_37_36]